MHPGTPRPLPWRVRVSQAVRDAKIEIIGREDVKNESHAEALIAVLRAYGQSRQGFVYVEPYLAKKAVRPQDVLLCHPETGVVIIEVKGHGIGDITRVAAGNLFVKNAGGGVTAKNALKQAETAMFDTKSAYERAAGRGLPVPVFDFLVALPRISEGDWIAKGFDRSLDRSRLLFREDLADPHRLRMQIGKLTREALTLSHRAVPIDSACFDIVRGIFGDSAVINNTNRPPRDPVDEDTIGGMIEYEESLDKNLSEEQQRLSRLSVGDFPRVIRGVAGSGKSIVLANMVARYLHRKLDELSEPSDGNDSPLPGRLPRVAVTCFNRALVPFLTAKIRAAFGEAEFDQRVLPNGLLKIDHLNDLMYNLPVPYRKVQKSDDGAATRAEGYLRDLIQLRQTDPKTFESCLFDVLFVDEGQDFVPEEFALLLELVRRNPVTNEKPILIFYDNAQNVYGRPQPTWSEMGIEVARGDRSRVMNECYRNTKQILEVAFNVLAGAQSKTAVHTRQFLDMETLNRNELITEGGNVIRVHFAKREGAEPIIKRFGSREKELEFVAQEIRNLVVEQFVRPSDILVLFRNDYEFQGLPDLISALPNASERIQGYLRIYGNTNAKNSYILQENHVTLSTITNAKGYDSPVVFLMGLDSFESARASDRPLFYVGATRAKHRLYLTGKKYGSDNLLAEASEVAWALRSLADEGVGEPGT